MEGGVRVFLHKVTVLKEKIMIKYLNFMSSMALWKSIILWWILGFEKFNNIFFWLHKGIALIQIEVLNLCCLLSSKHTPSSSCVKPVVGFHCRLCPLAVLFVRRNPGSQALPLILSFHQHQVVPRSPFSPGCPGLLWFHHDQVPQGLLGRMSCMSTSRFVCHYKMDKMKRAVKKRKCL